MNYCQVMQEIVKLVSKSISMKTNGINSECLRHTPIYTA